MSQSLHSITTPAVPFILTTDRPEGIVELTVGEQTTVRGNPGSMEFELDPAIESGSQRALFDFTRRVLHDPVPSLVANL